MRSEPLADHSHAESSEGRAIGAVPAPRPEQRETWVAEGFVAGTVGAILVAIFFLMVDLVQGRPFWTPTALGSALFRGELLAADAGPSAVLVLAYTGVHGAVFVAMGAIGAVLRAPARDLLGPGAGLLLAALLFAAFEVTFLSFAALFVPNHVAVFGAGWVAAANLIAAGAMAALLMRPAPWQNPLREQER